MTIQLNEEEFRLSFGQALSRAARVRCPYCGEGHLFAGLLRMNQQCGVCGTRLERDGGYFLGSTYINYGLTAGLTTVSYVLLHFGLGISNQVLMPGLMAFCLIFPLVFFRYARSLWLSLDCFFDRAGAQQMIASSQRTERGPANSGPAESRPEVSNNGG